MGDKYIIELEDKPFHKEDDDFLYRVKGFNSLVFDMTGISKLTPYTEPDLEQVRKEANKIGYEKGYRDGVNRIGDAEDKIRKEAYEQGQKDLRESCVPKDEEAYGIGYNEGFQCGLDLAWYAARKLYEIDWDVLCDLFGKVSVRSELLDMFTASEVLQKLRAYEQEKEEVKVGDEVEAVSGKAVIIDISDNKDKARYIYSDSTLGFDNICNLSKTGRYFPEIANVLEKMRNESNEQIDT